MEVHEGRTYQCRRYGRPERFEARAGVVNALLQQQACQVREELLAQAVGQRPRITARVAETRANH